MPESLDAGKAMMTVRDAITLPSSDVEDWLVASDYDTVRG